MRQRSLRPPGPPITPEELELLRTAEKELEKRARVKSFDYDRFCKRTGSGERWQVLLQTHLYFDHVITLTLTEGLVRPDEIDVRRMSFAQKLQLISALGLLRSEFVAPVAMVNDLRNKIAHNMSFEISDKNEQDFRNCVPKFIRDFIESGGTRWGGPSDVRGAVARTSLHGGNGAAAECFKSASGAEDRNYS